MRRANSGPRWSIVGWSIARRMRSGTLVGPGICRKWRPEGCVSSWNIGPPAANGPREFDELRVAKGIITLDFAQPSGAGHEPVNAPETKPVTFLPRSAAGELARRLAGSVEGEVLFDRASRGRYSTDASIYQIEPVGVLVPKSEADVRAAFDACRELARPAASARRRQFPVRPDRRRGAGRRPQQASQPRRRLRSRRDDGDGRARHRAR